MQRIIVYIIIGAAVIISALITYRRFTRPSECSHFEGCKDCPLADKCSKKSSD